MEFLLAPISVMPQRYFSHLVRLPAAYPMAPAVPRLGEENRHQNHNDGDHRDEVLRYRHERVILLLVSWVIVAACCGVFHLTVVIHRNPSQRNAATDLA